MKWAIMCSSYHKNSIKEGVQIYPIRVTDKREELYAELIGLKDRAERDSLGKTTIEIISKEKVFDGVCYLTGFTRFYIEEQDFSKRIVFHEAYEIIPLP